MTSKTNINKNINKNTHTQRIAMGISYRGNAYSGWQRQPHCCATVQENLENAIANVANEPVSLICAGRTDSGVHGTGQVIHFDSFAKRSEYSWQMGTNRHLPRDIRVHWVREVDDEFHARFSAGYRRYHYVIEDDSIGNAIFTGLVTPYRYALNVEKMHVAAQCLLGEQDFSSFRAAQCQSNTPFRYIEFIDVRRSGRFIIVDIQANAFLYHMVRNIVGALLVIGKGNRRVEWLAEILAAQDRRQAPATAPADGLYLVEVGYDAVYQLPLGGEPLPFLSSSQAIYSE